MFHFDVDPEPVFPFIPAVMNKSVLKSFSLFCVVALVVTILTPAAHAARTKGSSVIVITPTLPVMSRQ